jgi:PAS domain S-box-containing protein
VSDPATFESGPQTLPQILRPVLDPSVPTRDAAFRRRSRLLAAFLLILAVVFGAVDAAGLLSVPGYRPPWYGYVLLLGAFLLNRRAHYAVAATLTLAMFPIVVFSVVMSGRAADPELNLTYLVLGVVLASILVTARGTVLFAALSLAGILLTPVLVPGIVPSLRIVVVPLALVALATGLSLVSMAHRDRIESDRQAELRDSEERLRLALRAAHMGTWQWDVRSGEVRWSEGVESMFRLPPGGFAGTYEAYLGRIHDDDRPAVEEAMRAVLAGEKTRLAIRHRIVGADGAIRWIEETGRVVRDRAGRPLRMLGTVFDVTDRQHAEAEREALIHELEVKNAELERFSYTVSHDLKSPLITIRGFLGFVERDAAEGRSDRLRQDVERIVNATDRMHRLLDELLRLSRVGRFVNPPERVAFETIAREAVALVRARLQARGVEAQIAPDLPEIHGDRLRLVEVVQNLVENAVKFLGDQKAPSIRIGARPRQGDSPPVLFVQDNGIGIEPEHHDRVFGLFEKLDPHTEGTGVGLALVKRIIEVHEGRIWIESSGRGSGTTVCFTLPDPPPSPEAAVPRGT